MKLDLKYILPYAPYNVGIKILNHKCDYVGIEHSTINGYYFLGGSLHITYEGGSTGKSIQDFKLVLRPLSDLTKEIEHNGEKFVPLYRLIKEDKAFTNDFIYAFGYEELKVSVYELLLEWHFDIYGLIKQYLAVDINAL